MKHIAQLSIDRFMSSGYVGSNILYDVDANSPKRPRLIIHSIRSEEGQ